MVTDTMNPAVSQITSTSERSYNAIMRWTVVNKPQIYGDGAVRLRIEATFNNGRARILPPAFVGRENLDKYVRRFLPHLQALEVVPENITSAG